MTSRSAGHWRITTRLSLKHRSPRRLTVGDMPLNVIDSSTEVFANAETVGGSDASVDEVILDLKLSGRTSNSKRSDRRLRDRSRWIVVQRFRRRSGSTVDGTNASIALSSHALVIIFDVEVDLEVERLWRQLDGAIAACNEHRSNQTILNINTTFICQRWLLLQAAMVKPVCVEMPFLLPLLPLSLSYTFKPLYLRYDASKGTSNLLGVIITNMLLKGFILFSIFRKFKLIHVTSETNQGFSTCSDYTRLAQSMRGWSRPEVVFHSGFRFGSRVLSMVVSAQTIPAVRTDTPDDHFRPASPQWQNIESTKLTSNSRFSSKYYVLHSGIRFEMAPPDVIAITLANRRKRLDQHITRPNSVRSDHANATLEICRRVSSMDSDCAKLAYCIQPNPEKSSLTEAKRK